MLPAGFVGSLGYKPGWRFRVGGPGNGSLCVFATTPDSRGWGERTTQHMFPIPDFTVESRSPERWVMDCLLLCEQHEAGEFFQVGDRRPFYPYHQDEGSPYVLVERSA